RATQSQSAPVRLMDQPMPVFYRDAERLFRKHMLARGQRRMTDLEMRVGRGQVDHHFHLRIAQQRVDRERANAELVGLGPRWRFQNIRTRRQPHAAKRREILHIDGGDDSAADDADAKILHRSLPQRHAAVVAEARRANLATSLGLSCAATNNFTPMSFNTGSSVDQSSTPWPGSAQPSSSSHCPAGPRPLTWTASIRLA